MEDVPEQDQDNNEDDNEGQLIPAVRHRFVFKYQMRYGHDINTINTIVDVTNLDFPDPQLDRAIRGFFSFLENVDFDSRAIYEKTLDTLLTARLRAENPESFGKNISVSPDSNFEAFLVRLRTFDVNLIKDLYRIYIGAQSMN